MSLATTKIDRSLVPYPHVRAPWQGNEIVLVCTRYGRINGSDEGMSNPALRRERYKRAKEQGDYDAADKIVAQAMSDGSRVIDLIVDCVAEAYSTGAPLLCAVPHPPYDDSVADGADLVGRPRVRNALPLQYAARLAIELGAEFASDIVQVARVGRTKLGRFPRFLWQPSFKGSVRTDAAYILVDDVFIIGGTLSALRAYILNSGGTIAAVTTLAHRSGRPQPLALTRVTWDTLADLFGSGFDAFWKLEIGHDARCLTEAEGQSLVRWARDEGGGRTGNALLQRLRDRLATAAAKGE